MFEKFTDRARRVVVLAQEESRLLDCEHIGTEHLLLGILREGEGAAALALAGLSLDLDQARRIVLELTGRGDGAPSGHVPFTPRAKKVLELALREALEMGHDYIGTEHLLLGLLREGEGVGAQVLQRVGADLDTVRQQVIEILRSGAAITAEPPPPALAPLCPGCGSSLEGQLGLRVLEATGDATGEKLPLPIVYCRRCGRALGPQLGK